MSLVRLDLLLLERQLVTSRTKAQDLIRAGFVKVDGKIEKKAGEQVKPDSEVVLLAEEHPFVSRGGVKLSAALAGFGISVEGKRALDIGQSTGGFTHCLLLSNASAVVGVEVGHGQLDPKLVADPRVSCLENQDFRELLPEMVRPAFAICVADLSFISLRLIVPSIPSFLAPGADVILLVKPQFEVGPGNVGSGGIVRNATVRLRALADVEKLCREAGFTVAGNLPSPVEGGDGNQEFLVHLRWPS